MSPKFKPGEIVKVYEYYACGDIVKDAYYGVVLSVNAYEFSKAPCYIYNVLPNDQTSGRFGVQTAEEFAVEEYIQ